MRRQEKCSTQRRLLRSLAACSALAAQSAACISAPIRADSITRKMHCKDQVRLVTKRQALNHGRVSMDRLRPSGAETLDGVDSEFDVVPALSLQVLPKGGLQFLRGHLDARVED